MYSIVNWINAAGSYFVNFAWTMLLESAVVIVAVLIADMLLKKHVRAVWRYWLWMLVVVKLVMPVSIASPVGVANVARYFSSAAPAVVNQPVGISEKAGVGTVEAGEESVGVGAAVLTSGDNSEVGVEGQGSFDLSWQGVLFCLWFFAMAGILGLLFQRAYFVRQVIEQSAEASERLQSILEREVGAIGIKQNVRLRISACATSPVVCGVFRPVILIPEDIEGRLSEKGLKAVLLHELVHIRRGDVWVNLVQVLLAAAYFYNPLVWLFNRLAGRVREQAVDEAVMVAMEDHEYNYAQTLVEVAKVAFERPALSLRMIGVVENKSALAERVKHMLNRPIPKNARLSLAGVVAIVLAAAILLPTASAGNVDNSDVELVVSPTEAFLEGREIELDKLESELAGVDNKKRRTLELAITTKQIPYDRYEQAKNSAKTLAREMGFKGFEFAGVVEKQTEQKKPRRVKGNGIVGKWIGVDYLANPDDFMPGVKSCQMELHLKEVTFLKSGKTSSVFSWKGKYITADGGKYKFPYIIKNIDAVEYLFVPWISGDVKDRGQKPKYYVFVRADRKETAVSAVQPGGLKANTELGYDNGKSSGRDSIRGGGHGVLYEAPSRGYALKGIKVFGSRYGYPKAPDEDFYVYICGENFNVIKKIAFPYSRFARADKNGNPRWVTLRFDEVVDVPQTFGVWLDFRPEKTKGVYVHYCDQSSGNSYRSNRPGRNNEVFDKGDWMIHGMLVPAETSESRSSRSSSDTAEAGSMYTQEAYNDIGADGAIRFRTVISYVNESMSMVRDLGFVNSDFVKVESMSGADGEPIEFSSAHEGQMYRYKAKLNQAVLPGERVKYSQSGTMAGLVNAWPGRAGVYKYYMKHHPSTGSKTRRIETYLLPAGAKLISAKPANFKKQVKDGRLELKVDKVIEPGGSITTEIVYKLSDSVKSAAGSKAQEKSDKGRMKTDAVEAAQQWLKLIDAGDYEKSQDEYASLFRNTMTKAKFAEAMRMARAPLGDLVSREVTSSHYTQNVPGAPDGDYVIITFTTSFANKKEAIETVTPMREKDGRWRVSGYYIR